MKSLRKMFLFTTLDIVKNSETITLNKTVDIPSMIILVR